LAAAEDEAAPFLPLMHVHGDAGPAQRVHSTDLLGASFFLDGNPVINEQLHVVAIELVDHHRTLQTFQFRSGIVKRLTVIHQTGRSGPLKFSEHADAQ
jgi:hypothetical protein